MWIDKFFLIQFVPDIVYVAAGKSNSTGHVGTSHHVSRDDSSPATSCNQTILMICKLIIIVNE
jgi:hypothetical protein